MGRDRDAEVLYRGQIQGENENPESLTSAVVVISYLSKSQEQIPATELPGNQVKYER